MTITADQQSLIAAIRRALWADNEVEGAWLAGSLGRHKGDAFSDVDVLVLVVDGKLGDVTARYAKDVSIVAEPVLVNARSASAC